MFYYRHDAADRPHVDGAGVVGGAQQDLGRAVPARAHVVRVGRRGADLARKPEVRDLNEVRRGAEDVLRLEVAVEEAVPVRA